MFLFFASRIPVFRIDRHRLSNWIHYYRVLKYSDLYYRHFSSSEIDFSSSFDSQNVLGVLHTSD